MGVIYCGSMDSCLKCKSGDNVIGWGTQRNMVLSVFIVKVVRGLLMNGIVLCFII